MTRYNWDNFPPGARRTFTNCSRAAVISSFRKFIQDRGPEWADARISTKAENHLPHRKGWYEYVHCTRALAPRLIVMTELVKEHRTHEVQMPCHVRRHRWVADKMELIMVYGRYHVLDLKTLPEDEIKYIWERGHAKTRLSRARWEHLKIGETIAVCMPPCTLRRIIPDSLIPKMMFPRFHIRRCSTPLRAEGKQKNGRWYAVTRAE